MMRNPPKCIPIIDIQKGAAQDRYGTAPLSLFRLIRRFYSTTLLIAIIATSVAIIFMIMWLNSVLRII